MKPYQDKNHPGNSKEFHTGKICIEKGCDRPAGTQWSPLWCVDHNIERMDRISKNLKDILGER